MRLLVFYLQENVTIIGMCIIIRAFSGFWFDSENELKFAPMRREKRSVAALHEHFRNEMGANFSHL